LFWLNTGIAAPPLPIRISPANTPRRHARGGIGRDPKLSQVITLTGLVTMDPPLELANRVPAARIRSTAPTRQERAGLSRHRWRQHISVARLRGHAPWRTGIMWSAPQQSKESVMSDITFYALSYGWKISSEGLELVREARKRNLGELRWPTREELRRKSQKMGDCVMALRVGPGAVLTGARRSTR